jgi:hypothetical protein
VAVDVLTETVIDRPCAEVAAIRRANQKDLANLIRILEQSR